MMRYTCIYSIGSASRVLLNFIKARTSLRTRSITGITPILEMHMHGCAVSRSCAWGAEISGGPGGHWPSALSTVDAPSSKQRKPAFRLMAEDSLRR